MNDRSRINPCGIYRRRTDVSRARRRICLNYFISHDFLLSVSPSAIHARALSHRERTSEPATSLSLSGGKKYIVFSSYLLSRKKSFLRIAPRFPTLNIEHHSIFMKKSERYRKIFFPFQTHICLLLCLTVFTKLERTIFYRKHCELLQKFNTEDRLITYFEYIKYI